MRGHLWTQGIKDAQKYSQDHKIPYLIFQKEETNLYPPYPFPILEPQRVLTDEKTTWTRIDIAGNIKTEPAPMFLAIINVYSELHPRTCGFVLDEEGTLYVYSKATTLEKDVHTGHCCLSHGCKYDDKNCTVMSFERGQEHGCEECWNEDHDRY